MLPHTLWSCAGSVTGVPRLMRPRGHSRGDPRCQHLGSSILLPALLHLGTPQSSLGTACAGAAPCSRLPGDTCIDTAEREIRHSEELHVSHRQTWLRPRVGQIPRDTLVLPQPRQQHQDQRGHPPSPRQDSWAGTWAALHRLTPRLHHLRSAFPSQGKAPGRSEHCRTAVAALRTLGSSLEHPTPRNP